MKLSGGKPPSQRLVITIAFLVLFAMTIFRYVQSRAAGGGKLHERRRVSASQSTSRPGAGSDRQSISNGLVDDSIAALRQIEMDTHDPAVFGELARRLWESGDYQGASDLLSKLDLADGKTDAELLGLRGLALIQLGKRPEAQKIRAALASRTADPSAEAWVGMLDATLAPNSIDRPHFAALCEKALPVRKSAYLAYALGDIEFMRGDREAALQNWKQSAQWSATWAMPLLRIAELLSLKGQYDAALQTAREAMARAPHSTVTAMTYAQLWDTAIQNGIANDPQQLLGFIDQQLAPHIKDDGRLLCIRTDVLATLGKRDDAIAAVRAALKGGHNTSEQSLLRLIAISRSRNLGLEEECRVQIEKDYGGTSDTALARANESIAAGHRADAVKEFEAARGRANDPQAVSWREAWVRILDRAGDPRTKAEIEQLEDDQPKDLQLQLFAIGSSATAGDRAFLDRAVGRIHELAGDGIVWRTARARVLLHFASDRKQFEEPAKLLEGVIRESSESIEAHVLLASAYENLQRYTDAADQMKIAVGINTSSAPLGLQLARELELAANFDAAHEELTRVSKLPSIDPATRLNLADLALQVGDVGLAMSLAGNAADNFTGSGNSGLFMARLDWLAGRTAQAEAGFRKLVENPSSDAATIQTAAEFYASQAKMAEAQTALSRLRPDPRHPGQAELVQANFALKHSTLESAIEHYMRAVAAEKSLTQAWLGLVLADLTAGRMSDAVSAAAQGAAASPGDLALKALSEHRDWVSVWAGGRDLRPLIEAFVRTPDQEAPAKSLETLIAARRANKSFAEVTAEIEGLIAKFPRFMPLAMYAIDLPLQAGRLDEAAAAAARAAQSFPSSAEPHIALVGIYRAQNNWSQLLGEAQKWRERSLANPLRPDLEIADADLALGQPEDAIRQLEPYVRSAGPTTEVFRTVRPRYGAALSKAGRPGVEALMEPLLEEGAEGRKAWIQFAVHVFDAPQASAWLDRAAGAIPAGAIDERVELASAWGELHSRTHDKNAGAKAREIFNSLINAPEPLPTALLKLGILDESDGNLKDAQAEYREAIQRSSQESETQVVAQNNLAMILARTGGDLAEAAKLAQSAAKARPNVAPLCDTLAFIEQKQQHYSAAMADAQTAVRLSPLNLQYRVRLAEVQLAGGHAGDAATTVRDIERLKPDPKGEPAELWQEYETVRTAVAGGTPRASVP